MPKRAIVLGELTTPLEVQHLRELLIDLFRLVDQAAVGTTQTLAASGTIAPNANYIPVAGSGGAVTLTSNPSIADGFTGQRLTLKGTSNTNTLTLTDGNGMQLAGNVTLGLNDTLEVFYDGTDWIEIARSNN